MLNSTPSAQNFSADPYIGQVRELIHQSSGIFTPDSRLRFLQDRCMQRMQSMQIASSREYFEYLTAGSGRATELKTLLNEITVGETCFFRNQPQLDAFMKTVLPAVMANKGIQPLRHLRIWSAGCSTGEEPYTLAMLLAEQSAGLLRNWTYEVIATDLNERSLLKAQEATYGEYALRNVQPYYLAKYFTPADGLYRVNQNIRSAVRFNRVNLVDDVRMVFIKAIDVIFCCNVLIYFDSSSKRRVVQHFLNNLLPNSYLFLGHSESLFGISSDFKLVHFPGATAYLKPPRGAALP